MSGSPSSTRVFIVDDDADTRDLLCEIFADAGFVAEGFADARSALAAARNSPPSAILTDLTLPDFSGEELALAIRDELGDSIRLFATTGRAVEPAAAPLFERVLTKPFDFDEVEAIVKASLAPKPTSG